MSAVDEGTEVRGLPVHQTVTSPDLPAVAAGSFAVRNDTGSPVCVSVDSVSVCAAGEDDEEQVGEHFLYRLPDYEEVPPGGVAVAPGAEASFEVSFPPQPLGPRRSHDVTVVIEVTVDGATRRVLSPWTWTIRTPRR